MSPPHRWTATDTARAWRAVEDWERARRCPQCPAGRAAEAAASMLRLAAIEAEAVERWHVDVVVHLVGSGGEPEEIDHQLALHTARALEEQRRVKRLRLLADRLEREGMPVRRRGARKWTDDGPMWITQQDGGL